MASFEQTEILAKLRHDLRTPLNAILGYCELLREDLAWSGIPTDWAIWIKSRLLAGNCSH